MLKHTPLYNLHLEQGAKMVPFAGYLMPIHYGKGTLHEHLHCRSHAGLFDISHMGQCLILGDNAIGGLEQLVPSEISQLEPGEQLYTVLTNNDGGIMDDIIITRIESGLMLIVNAACKDKVFRYLYNNLSGRCSFNELSGQSLFALQGPDAELIMQEFCPPAAELSFMQACGAYFNGIKCNISRSGYTGEDGFEILVGNYYANQLARMLLSKDKVELIGLAARDSLRLEAGLCLYGHELNESITPVEAGLKWLCSKKHGKYPGAEQIMAQLEHGPKKIRAGLLVKGKIPVRAGSDIYNGEGVVVGHVTSGSFSPSLERPIAMAMLDKSHAFLDNTLYASVRDRQIEVTVTRLPFIPHRYSRKNEVANNMVA